MKRFSRIFLQTYTFPAPSGDPRQVAWQPLVDIYERPDVVIIVMELPGVEQGRIRVAIEQNVLHVTGHRQSAIPNDTQRVYQMEIPHGPFARSVELPPCCDSEHVSSEYINGYLEIRIPRFPGQ